MLLSGFFQAISEEEENSDAWKNIVAGLATIRACESVLHEPAAPLTMYHRARGFVALAPNGAIKELLIRLLDAARPGAHIDPDERRSLLASRLLAYVLELHNRGDFAMAADVAEVSRFAAGDDGELAMEAAYRRAFALRVSQRFAEAREAYRHLAELASEYANPRMHLEALFGFAKLAANQGNIPESETLLDDVVAAAEASDEFDLLRKCYLQRAFIAGIRKRPVAVMQYSYLALDGMHDSFERERVYVNVAAALRELGHAQDSRRIAEFVALYGQQSEMRTMAAFTAYHLAIDDCDWTRAASIRHHLGNAKMTSAHATEFYETSAREFATRGRWDDALAMLQRMLSVAESERLAEQIIRADRAIDDVRAERVPVRYAFTPNPPTVLDERRAVTAIAAAVTALCTV